ncbi:unnamed protein product [Closterium sp. NIES-54]
MRRPKQRWVECGPPHCSPVRSPLLGGRGLTSALLLLLALTTSGADPLRRAAPTSSSSAAAAATSSPTPATTPTATPTPSAASTAPASSSSALAPLALAWAAFSARGRRRADRLRTNEVGRCSRGNRGQEGGGGAPLKDRGTRDTTSGSYSDYTLFCC